MILLAEKESRVHPSFLAGYPLVEELEIKISPADPQAVGRAMRRLGEELYADRHDELPKFWYMRRRAPGTFHVGLHAPLERQDALRHRLDAWIAAGSSRLSVTRLTASTAREAALLRRLPFAVSETLASHLMECFVAAC